VFAGFGLFVWAVAVAVLVVLANVVLHALEQRIGG
jgi:heme exporter protein D